MVRDGFGDESGAKLIEQRGIDFAPSEDFIQTLKAAGASNAFLNALRAAQPPEPASAKKPLNQVQVFALLVGQVPSHRVTMLVQERGIDFEPTDDYLQEVRLAGGEDELISALKSAKVTKPATVDPAAQVRQSEILKHVAQGTEFFRNERYADAEEQYRAAVRLAPTNSDLHFNVGLALNGQGDLDGAIREYREALRLSPINEYAHVNLGVALGDKGDSDGEIVEEREALRIDPEDDAAHASLGVALISKGDWDSASVECRAALRLNPSNEPAHVNFGLTLERKGDIDGAVAEFRTALRLNPNDPSAHFDLGIALEKKTDTEGALGELRAAYMLDPKNTNYKLAYERLLQFVNR
jgi:Flp pilus assembly protein TadD